MLNRTKYLGGSDAAAIMGYSKYKTSQQVWEEKTGRRAPANLDDNKFVQYGKAAEKPLIDLFVLNNPDLLVIQDKPWIQHPEYPFLGGNIDSRLVNTDSQKGVLEIKTAQIFSPVQKLQWRNQIPPNYYCQILHYFLVGEFDFAIVSAYLIVGNGKDKWTETRDYFCSRKDHEKDISGLLEEELKFWNCVISGKRPGLKLPNI